MAKIYIIYIAYVVWQLVNKFVLHICMIYICAENISADVLF